MTDRTDSCERPSSDGGQVSQASPKAVFHEYCRALDAKVGIPQAPGVRSIHAQLTDEQAAKYREAIRETARLCGAGVITPDLLFEAADAALELDTSPNAATIGLLPGTLNPIHFGHLTVAVSSIVAANLDGALLACGGAVPDKPHSLGPEIRLRLTDMAIRELELDHWLVATPIRQQAADLLAHPDVRHLVPQDESLRRSFTDIAAFIWLFRANPFVTWRYLVGSDKVRDYGRKSEHALIVGTLADRRAPVKVIYVPRSSTDDVVLSTEITPYEWLRRQWDLGLFERSSLNTCALSGFAVRRALANGLTRVDDFDLLECIPATVLSYIGEHDSILASYRRELSGPFDGGADQ